MFSTRSGTSHAAAKISIWSSALIMKSVKVFGNSARVYVCATIEWGKLYCDYGGQDPVTILPCWLTTLMQVKKN